MHVHPSIAALREHGLPQRCRMAYDAWIAQPDVIALSQDLNLFAQGKCLDDCSGLRTLLHNASEAQRFVDGLCRSVLSAMRKEPLNEAPFRHVSASGFCALHILSAGRAKLVLAAYEPTKDIAAPKTAVFTDRETHEIVLSGQAEARALTLRQRSSEITCEAMLLEKGVSLTTSPRRRARQILQVNRSLLVLQVLREPERPAPTQEITIATAKPVRTASGDKTASQALMALDVLGSLGSHAAKSVMQRTALSSSEDSDVRWEATRQLLSLDVWMGLRLLEELADHPTDPLSLPADNLRRALLKQHPQLKAIEKEIT